MLIVQDLILFRLGCWSHRTSSWFASDVDCTGLNLVCLGCWLHRTYSCLFIWARIRTHTSDASLVEIWSSLKILIHWILSSFSPKGLSEAFIGCKTFLHSAFLFQMRKHVSDAVCCVMYDCAWMKCLCIGFHFMFFFLSNLPLSHPCILCKPVGAVSFSSALGDIFISILAPRIVSYSSFLETEHSCSNL